MEGAKRYGQRCDGKRTTVGRVLLKSPVTADPLPHHATREARGEASASWVPGQVSPPSKPACLSPRRWAALWANSRPGASSSHNASAAASAAGSGVPSRVRRL